MKSMNLTMKTKAIVFEEGGGIRLSEVALPPCKRLLWLLRWRGPRRRAVDRAAMRSYGNDVGKLALKNVKLWNCANMEVWKYGSMEIWKWITALGGCGRVLSPRKKIKAENNFIAPMADWRYWTVIWSP